MIDNKCDKCENEVSTAMGIQLLDKKLCEKCRKYELYKFASGCSLNLECMCARCLG